MPTDNSRASRSRRSPRYVRIADKIAEFIDENNIDELPPAVDLATKFGVGEYSVGKAIQALAKRGILACAQGRRARVRKASDRAAEKAGRADMPLSSSGKKLWQMLRRDILDGKRRTGVPLPKASYLAASLQISRRSVTQALRWLAEDNLVHKEGKKWVVGPHDDSKGKLRERAPLLPVSAPVVVVLCYSFQHWNRIRQDHYLSSFFHALSRELVNCRLQLAVCGMTPQFSSPVSPSGPEDVRRIIYELGDRYMGSIIVSSYPNQFAPSPESWITLFKKLRKPVVWCDLSDHGLESLDNAFSSKLDFHPILMDRDKEVNTVLATLSDLGHTRIGVPYVIDKRDSWSERRMTNICRIAASEYPHLEMITVSLEHPLWSNAELVKNADMVSQNQHVENLKKFIRKTSGLLTPDLSRKEIMGIANFVPYLLKEKECTAIICPNDSFACRLYIVLKLLGARIPHDVSLVSWDNSTVVRSYPIATLDRGFDHEAYCAAHLILGDVPLRTDRKGVVFAECVMIDRGSLGRPRRKRVLI